MNHKKLEVEKDDIEEMNVEELQWLIINSYETAVSESASPRLNQNRKARPPKAVRKYNNIRKVCSRKLRNKTLTVRQRERLFDKIEKAELDIRAFYKEREEKEEAEAWKLMKENSQNFYRLSKKENNIKGIHWALY